MLLGLHEVWAEMYATWKYGMSILILQMELDSHLKKTIMAHLEIVFQEQSYSSLCSGRSWKWDHFHGINANPCGGIADPCGDWSHLEKVQALMLIIAWLTKHRKTVLKIDKHENIVNH